MRDLEFDEVGRRRAIRKARLLRVAVAVQRRRVAAALQALDSSGGQGPQGKKHREETYFSWLDHLARLTPDEFRLRYRLDYDTFDVLLRQIRSELEPSNEKQARRAKWGHLVEPEVKLAVTLRFLAGGMVEDLRMIYHMSKAYVYECVWCCVDAINNCAALDLDFPIDDVSKLQQLEVEFRARSKGAIWEGQVAAVDGVHLAMKAPTAKEVNDPKRYHVARKDEYALLCMAMCDVERRILWYDIGHAPQTHDSLAFSGTPLGQRVARGDLPSPFFINGDSAFAASPSMVTPSGETGHDDYNYHQSANRMPIECAFGILVRRFGIFWRPLSMRFNRRAPVVGACIRLHNLCISRRLANFKGREDGCLTEIQPHRWEVTPHFDRWGRPLRFLVSHGRRRAAAALPRPRTSDDSRYTRLRELVRIVADSGLRRPPLRDGVRRKNKRGRR